jgi:hypothetical protein
VDDKESAEKSDITIKREMNLVLWLHADSTRVTQTALLFALATCTGLINGQPNVRGADWLRNKVVSLPYANMAKGKTRKSKSRRPNSKKKRIDSETLPCDADADASLMINSTPVLVGLKVEARYYGMEAYEPGKIVIDNGDGTIAVQYDDG